MRGVGSKGYLEVGTKLERKGEKRERGERRVPGTAGCVF